MSTLPRILVAGVGNIFKGDDGFGVAVVGKLAARQWEGRVEVADYGIRTLDLGYSLLSEKRDLVILVDIAQRNGPPGTVYVITPDFESTDASSGQNPISETHGVHPAILFQWVKTLAGELPAVQIVACEPAEICGDDDLKMGLSDPVSQAVEHAVSVVEELIREAQCTSLASRPE